MSNEVDTLNKLPLKSKKFIAYLISEVGWKLVLFYVLWEYENKIEHYAFMVLISVIITSGFIQIGYILGQAFVDRYTSIAISAIESAKDEKPKDH